MHVAFFTVRMRKGFGVDLVVDRWARGLIELYGVSKRESTTHVFNVKHQGEREAEAARSVENPAGVGVETAGEEENAVETAAFKYGVHRVTVFCFDYDGETYKNAPYEIVPLHLSRDKSNKFLPLLEADTANTIRALKSEIESGKREKIDIAMSASFPFYGAGRILGVRTIHLHFGNPPTAGLKWWTRANRAYLEKSDIRHMRRAERVIAISHYLRSQLPEDVWARTTVVYPGADHLPQISDGAIKAMRERIETETADYDGDAFVLCVSRLDYKAHPYKGVLETVNLVNRLRKGGTKIRLVLAGVGSRASIAELRARGAIVVDAPSFEELAALYRACDIFLSLSSWEGFGLPVAEAALAEMPTVALAVAAHQENAVAYPVASITEAAQAVRELALNPDLRREKGSLAAEMARKFTWMKSCDEFTKAMQDL